MSHHYQNPARRIGGNSVENSETYIFGGVRSPPAPRRNSGYQSNVNNASSNDGPVEEGYDEVFFPALAAEYKCPICKMVLTDPMQTECGHRFCKTCLDRHMRIEEKTCPVDSKVIEPIFADNYAKREINQSTVKCRTTKSKKACPWTGPLQELQAHYDVCDFVNVHCPLFCGQTFERRALENHIKKGCAFCKTEVQLNNYKDHLERCQKDLVQCPSCNKRMLREKLSAHEKECPKSLGEIRNAIVELKARMCNGVYLWRITGYARHFRLARLGIVTALYSAPFYTDFNGYKLCLRVNPNGVDAGYGSHISVFKHMMRSDWDDILEWPFSGRISLSIVDQSDDGDYKHHINETLVTKPNLLAFRRPTSPRNHEGYGYVEFAHFDTLKERQYIKNDCLLIRVEVFQ